MSKTYGYDEVLCLRPVESPCGEHPSKELRFSGRPAWIYHFGNRSFRNLEDDHKAWDSMGRREDFAAGALLWDLYDNDATYGPNGRDDDNIEYSVNELWNMFNDAGVRDMKDVYDKLSGSGVRQEVIDEVFVDHGFFVDANGKIP